MIRQCAWCLKLLGESPPLHDKSVTHGICEICEKKFIEESKRYIKEMRKDK